VPNDHDPRYLPAVIGVTILKSLRLARARRRELPSRAPTPGLGDGTEMLDASFREVLCPASLTNQTGACPVTEVATVRRLNGAEIISISKST
jgi:hypothetical protein